MTRERILTYLGYNAFFWLSFWLFAYWTFPYDRVATFLTDKVAESGTGYTMEIGSLAPYWISGVELENVKVYKKASDPTGAPSTQEAAKKTEQAMRIPSAHARLGLLALLTGSNDVTFAADLGKGELSGSYEEDEGTQVIEATLDKIDLAEFGLLASVVPLPMKGVLSGDIDLTVEPQPSKTEGKIDLKVQNLTIGDGNAKVALGSMGGLTIDPINAGDLVVALDVKQGVGMVQQLSANGTDLRLQGSGDVRFASPLMRSRLNMLLRLELTDAYKNKSSRTQAMFALLETSGVPQVTAAKTPDGAYQVRLSGTIAAPRVVPAGQRVQQAPTALPPPAGPEPGDEDAED